MPNARLAEAEEATEDILGDLRALRHGRARTQRQFDELIGHLHSEPCLHLPYHTSGAGGLLLRALPEICDEESTKRMRKPRTRRTR